MILGIIVTVALVGIAVRHELHKAMILKAFRICDRRRLLVVGNNGWIHLPAVIERDDSLSKTLMHCEHIIYGKRKSGTVKDVYRKRMRFCTACASALTGGRYRNIKK